jgi:hypothetical protein
MFEVVCRRYERGSIVLTANKCYVAWAEVFSGDEVIARRTSIGWSTTRRRSRRVL